MSFWLCEEMGATLAASWADGIGNVESVVARLEEGPNNRWGRLCLVSQNILKCWRGNAGETAGAEKFIQEYFGEGRGYLSCADWMMK